MNNKEKYLKYKKKYLELKKQYGGECDPLPEEDDMDNITLELLSDYRPEERITISGKCYFVDTIYEQIITRRGRIPHNQQRISDYDRIAVIASYQHLHPETLPQNRSLDESVMEYFPRGRPTNIGILDCVVMHQLYPNHNISAIYLENTGITHINANAFDFYPNLTYITLSNNQIENIYEYTFKNLYFLDTIAISNNYIVNIELNAFYNLPALKYLMLTNNRIETLQSFVFNNLQQISSIELGYNNIASIERNAFNNLSTLQSLHLNDNKIEELLEYTFSDLDGIVIILLHNNRIRLIKEHAFYKLPLLQKLFVCCNKIINIEPNAFNDLPLLRILNLQNQKPALFYDKSFDNILNNVPLINIQSCFSSFIYSFFNGLFQLQSKCTHNDFNIFDDLNFNI
jgi:hypothetical protein